MVTTDKLDRSLLSSSTAQEISHNPNHDTKTLENPTKFLDDSQFLNLHQKVVNSGLYNFEGCRIPLQTRLNIPFFCLCCQTMMTWQFVNS